MGSIEVIEKLRNSLSVEQREQIKQVLTESQFTALTALLHCSEEGAVAPALDKLNEEIMETPAKAMEVYDLLTEDQTGLIEQLNE